MVYVELRIEISLYVSQCSLSRRLLCCEHMFTF